MTALEEELGDLLLQIVFHSVIEEECSDFTLRDVTTGITNKLIYRHPHVFGSVHVDGTNDVLANWEKLKQKEKHQQTVADTHARSSQSIPRTDAQLQNSKARRPSRVRLGHRCRHPAESPRRGGRSS